MGCSSSSIQVQTMPKRQKAAPVLPSQTIMTVKASLDSDERLKKSFEIITKDINEVASPPNQMAIVCLTSDTFPILVAPNDDEENETENQEPKENQGELIDTTIRLPTIAASYSTSGRLVCFSQFTFLTNAILQIGQTMKLVTRTINWLCDGKVEDSPIGIFTKSPELNETLVSCLKRLNMNPIENTDLQTDLSESKLIIVSSDVDTSDTSLYAKLVEFSMGGGGILVFYNHNDEQDLSVNNFLLHYGLSYSSYIINQNEEDCKLLQTNHDFDKMKLHNFVYLKELLAEVMDLERPDATQLDTVVTDFRFYMNCTDDRQVQSLVDLANHAWDFLNRTNYNKNGEICPEPNQKIVALLLLDLYRKIPLTSTLTIPESRIFPGIPGEEIDSYLDNHTKLVEFTDSAWVTTGLYLPPGRVGVIRSPEPFPDLVIQVGSHTISLLPKEREWHRWPLITYGFYITDEAIEVGSQFGGIVYVTSEDPEIEALELDFEGFCEYPRYVQSDPSIWTKTKDLKIPLGEIETNSIIFTLPSSYMYKLNLAQITEKFELLHHAILTSLGSSFEHQARVVFDIDLPEDDSYCGYPISEKIDMIESLFNNINKDNLQLFNFLVKVATSDIRENSFDDVIETAFATYAVCRAFIEAFQKFDPYKLRGFKPPKLFDELWIIHNKGNKSWIPKALSKFQDPSYVLSNIPEDTWIAFVRELSRVGKHDFTNLLDKIYPIPLNMPDSLQNLPKFKY